MPVSLYHSADCAVYRDLRDLLARGDIDAVLIATGPSWHGTAAILAAQAGKDVYCEKPCTRTIAQSLRLAETFRRGGRIFQAGTQRRNLPHFEFAVKLARRGRLGRLQAVHAHPMSLETKMSGWAAAEPEPPQEEFDWDLYLGPAAWRPYSRAHLNSFNFEEGGGMVGGGVLPWGSHTVDLCQWANNADDTAPVEYGPVVEGTATAQYANGASPYAVLDLAGNTWDWCLTEWGTDSPALNGTKERAVRGGSWNTNQQVATCSARSFQSPDTINDSFGFRVCVDLHS